MGETLKMAIRQTYLLASFTNWPSAGTHKNPQRSFSKWEDTFETCIHICGYSAGLLLFRVVDQGGDTEWKLFWPKRNMKREIDGECGPAKSIGGLEWIAGFMGEKKCSQFRRNANSLMCDPALAVRVALTALTVLASNTIWMQNARAHCNYLSVCEVRNKSFTHFVKSSNTQNNYCIYAHAPPHSRCAHGICGTHSSTHRTHCILIRNMNEKCIANKQLEQIAFQTDKCCIANVHCTVAACIVWANRFIACGI